jgi:Tannase and feruloyl esterase
MKCRSELPALLFAATSLPGILLAGTCESIAGLKLPDTSITIARIVPAGEFSGPDNTPTAAQQAEFKKLPAFCRVQGAIRPSSDSNIDFEVWLPIAGWNGRYLGVGNGGFAGSINYFSANGNAPSMAQALAAGYATSSTDTGHKGSITDADWAVGHPEKVTDYGYRAVHATAVDAKKIIASFYSKQPTSYFSSCSNGGRQALMEAQRYPADYAGIVAGDPAWYATHLAAAQIWNQQAIMANQNSYVPASKLPAITAAVLDKCDELDGVEDGVIDDPRKCHFDPAVLLCKGGDSDTCLTGPQVEGLKKIYAGPTNSAGRQIFPGIFPGGEAGPGGWGLWIMGAQPGRSLDYLFGVGGLAKIVYQDPAWDFRRFSLDSDVAFLDDKLGPVRNATNANLKPFKNAGGKLILYHGWSDPDIAPLSTIDYYQNVTAKMSDRRARQFVRVYMVPGMQHCGGGAGATVLGSVPNSDAGGQNGIQAVLERWVEKGSVPAEIIATKDQPAGRQTGGVAVTRPICPYPTVARYKGVGITDEASNYSCVSER